MKKKFPLNDKSKLVRLDIRWLPTLRNKWIRFFLTVVLILIIGMLVYQIWIGIQANRDYSSANEALARFDYKQANDHLKKYLAVRPTDSTALLMAAHTARRQNDFEAARRWLGLASKNGADREEVDRERQLQGIHAGNVSLAESFAGYCNEHPTNPESAMFLEAIIEGSLKSEVVPLARWGVDLWLKHRLANIDQAQGLYWRGRISLLDNEISQGVADLERALELAPEHFLARVWLAEFLTFHNPRQAADHLDILRLRYPNDLTVRFQTAKLYRNLGQPEKAGAMSDELLASPMTDRSAVLLERGKVALDLNLPQEAETWLFQARSLAPNSREVSLALADCFRQAGNLVEARRYLDLAREIDEKAQKVLEERKNPKKGK